MTWTVRVAGSDIAFPCAPETTILDAAQAAGYEMPYSCRSGVCHNCRGRVAKGAFEGPVVERHEVLFCQARPRSDLEIAPRSIARRDPAARQVVDARVYRIERPTAGIALLQLRFPAGTRVKFRAGQYLQVLLEDGARRSFSMANPPQQSDGAHLHVRAVPGGRFSERVLPGLAPGAMLRVELPHGDFHLREGSGKPAVFVASGTGFAPVKSVLEDAFRRGEAREMTLYWGARTRADLYLLELPQKWAARHRNFHFVPVLSEPTVHDGWGGRTGWVHRAVLEDFPTLAGHEVYACGVSAMVEAARTDFQRTRDLDADDFHCDAFVTPADAAATG
jgi:NAD(P)H-flavin reductase/ferredoxin